MFKSKRISQNQVDTILEPKLSLIDQLRGETLQHIALYLRKLKINFGYLVDFLNAPNYYPGSPEKITLIVDKFLNEVISDKYFEIQEENLQISFVYDTIFNQIFRGKIKYGK